MLRAGRAAPWRRGRARAVAAAALVAAGGGVLAFAPAGGAPHPAAAEAPHCPRARLREAALEEAAAAESRAFGLAAGAVGSLADPARADEEWTDFSYSTNAFDDSRRFAGPFSFQQLCDLSELLEWVALGMGVALLVAFFRFSRDGSAARLMCTFRPTIIGAAICLVVDMFLAEAAGGRPLPGLFQSYY